MSRSVCSHSRPASWPTPSDSATPGQVGSDVPAEDRQVLCRFRLLDGRDHPLVLTKSGELLALDGKVTFDDNAAFRHKDLAELRDLTEEEPTEVQAQAAGLSYVKLDGNIGCLVNGAGLAMSTMDLIKFHGGEPANFLDVGGGPTLSR